MTPVHEDEVIARLRELVSQGQYLDDLYGRPGENLDGATMIRLDDGSAAWLGERPRGRRHYRRGSSEYASAKAAGLMDPLPPLLPARPAAVLAASAIFPPAATTVASGGQCDCPLADSSLRFVCDSAGASGERISRYALGLR